MALEVKPSGSDGQLNSGEPTGQRAGSQITVVGGGEPESYGSEPARRGGPRTAEGKKVVSQNAVTHGVNFQTQSPEANRKKTGWPSMRASAGHLSPWALPKKRQCENWP